MRIIIEIDCGNDSFFTDFDGELGLILKSVPGKVANICGRASGCLCDAPESDDKIQDSNGNTVGSVQVRK